MHFTQTDIDGPVVVDLAPHRDERLLPMGVAEGCRLGGRWTWTRTSRMTTSSSPPVAGGRHRTSYHGHPPGAPMHAG
jgi:hypothetical protein